MAGSPKTAYQKWQDGINSSINNNQWEIYDCEIQRAVNEYNRHLYGKGGYHPLDWHLIKAMIWVETGADSDKWASNPIQIGNIGDPGLNAFLSNKEGGEAIMPPSLQGRLTSGTAITIPAYNIRAGIGYLLMRMARFSIQSVMDPNTTMHTITVKQGDSLERIASANQTTVDVLRKLNPKAGVLHPGDELKYQKASLMKVIVGWKPMSTSNIAAYYNVGDPLYDQKLKYALSIMRTGASAICA